MIEPFPLRNAISLHIGHDMHRRRSSQRLRFLSLPPIFRADCSIAVVRWICDGPARPDAAPSCAGVNAEWPHTTWYLDIALRKTNGFRGPLPVAAVSPS